MSFLFPTGTFVHGVMVCVLFHVRCFLWLVLSHKSGASGGGGVISTGSRGYARTGKMNCSGSYFLRPKRSYNRIAVENKHLIK